MKILYIGHYKEGGGWSNAAIDYIQALDSIGLDVVCRNIALTNTNAEVPEKILELENKSLHNVDFCIQHVLPHHLVGSQKFKKNIAYFVSESNTLKYNNWISHLNLMDEIWTANHSNKDVLENSYIEKPVKVVPHTFDMNKYNKHYDKINMYEINQKYKFYYIGDLNDRKNISSVIRCFHSEFCNGEQVALIIKIRKFGLDPQSLRNYFVNLSNSIKSRMRISSNIKDYAPELIISTDMSQEQINQLHNTCDCFINISHGEAWSIPAFDAMAFGKTPICSNEGGPRDFIDSNNKNTGSLINGIYNICDHSDPAFADIFTGKEEWFIPSEIETKKMMRYYYENRENINRNDGLVRASNFNYENVANKIKEYLCE